MDEHTPGPWRWEYSPKRKSVTLVGGRPQFDKTVMDFSRVGLSGAGPLFIDRGPDKYSILCRLVDKAKEWCRPIKDREHHAGWIQEVIHPDAQLIAAAPELLEALEACAESLAFARDKLGMFGDGDDRDRKADTFDATGSFNALELARAAINKATGK